MVILNTSHHSYLGTLSFDVLFGQTPKAYKEDRQTIQTLLIPAIIYRVMKNDFYEIAVIYLILNLGKSSGTINAITYSFNLFIF
jgi:hypothetical protein